MKTSEVLYKAADLIDKRGWTTGQWGSLDETSPLCLEGAILAAIGEPEYGEIEACPAGRAVRDYLGLPDDDTEGMRLYNWNDQTGEFSDYTGIGPRRTQAEVIEVLRAAAVLEEARERQAVPA